MLNGVLIIFNALSGLVRYIYKEDPLRVSSYLMNRFLALRIEKDS